MFRNVKQLFSLTFACIFVVFPELTGILSLTHISTNEIQCHFFPLFMNIFIVILTVLNLLC